MDNQEINPKLSNALDEHVPLSPQWKLGFGKGNQFAPQGGHAHEAPKSALIGDWDGKQSSISGSFASPGQPRWKEDERDTSTRRWGGPAIADGTGLKSWADSNGANNPRVPVNPGAAPPDRWAPPGAAAGVLDGAGRGRGLGSRGEDRWLAKDRNQPEPWSLPGMGEALANPPPHGETKPRWGDNIDPQKISDGKPAVERWRGPAATAASAAAAANPQAPGAAPLGESSAAAAGRGRGFTVGRGRGIMRAAPFSPGTDRWGEGRSASEIIHGGSAVKYSLQALSLIKQQVGKAPPPAALIAVASDYPEILADPSDGSRPFFSHQAFAADQWVYKDPQGVIQGPFTRVEILDWHSAGFFPNELPVKGASDPDSQFLPLMAMVKMWERVDHGSAPPGFAPPLQSKPQPQTTANILNSFDNVLGNQVIPDSISPRGGQGQGQGFAPPSSVTGLWSSLTPHQPQSTLQANPPQASSLNAWLPSVPPTQGLSHLQGPPHDPPLFGRPQPPNPNNNPTPLSLNPWINTQDPVLSNAWAPSIGQPGPGYGSFAPQAPSATPQLSAWGQPLSGIQLMPSAQQPQERPKEINQPVEQLQPTGPTVNASMPAPLQQLFAAAQRAGQQQQEQRAAIEQQQRLQQQQQQQQQQQESLVGLSSDQLHVSSLDNTPQKPAEPKFAPWAAAAQKAPAAKTLREIQEEEAARSAEAMRQSQQDGSSGPTPNSQIGGVWSKIASGPGTSSLSPPPGVWGGGGKSPSPAVLHPNPRGPTLGDILDRQLNPNPQPKAPAWGGAGLREFNEESAADLEGGGGDDDEGLAYAISQQQQALASIAMAGSNKPSRSMREIQEEEERERARQNAPAQDDPMLFWDYGGAQDPSKAVGNRPAPPPPPPTRPAGMTAAAIAAKGAALPPAPAPPKGGWAAAALVGKVVVPPPAPNPPARPAQAVAPKPAQATVVRLSEPSAPEPPSVSDHVVLMVGDMALSPDFRDWCREQLRKLTGSDDLSLVEVILTMPSRSEVADTCNMALGNKTGVGAFVAEFLKRKDAEVQRIQQAAKKKGSKKK